MKISEIMSSDVLTVGTDTSLKQVAEVLADQRISGLPVVDRDGVVVGVVSEADILFKERGPSSRRGVFAWLLDRYGFEGQLKLEARVAGEAMTVPAIVIEPQRPVAEAAHIMLERRVNRLPVVHDGELVGIVTRSDLVKAFARPDDAIEREIREDVLSHTLWLREPEAIAVAVEDGTVKLQGMVDNPADAELVEVFARRVPGVVDVESSLTWLGENGNPG
ncbi:MAG TPA: CBS domain-containing protein [Gaiellaceae bacterium]|jgi:CBS domain-containing protein